MQILQLHGLYASMVECKNFQTYYRIVLFEFCKYTKGKTIWNKGIKLGSCCFSLYCNCMIRIQVCNISSNPEPMGDWQLYNDSMNYELITECCGGGAGVLSAELLLSDWRERRATCCLTTDNSEVSHHTSSVYSCSHSRVLRF